MKNGGIKPLNNLCLVLNQNYEPISITRIKRAICLVYAGKAEIVEKYSFYIHTVKEKFIAPSVLRLLYFANIRRYNIPLNKKNIFKRDNYTCQYCGKREGPFTIDHVIPKKKGGEESWENLVTCCIKCNNKKGDKTPSEAKMKLIRKPKKPFFFFIIYYPLEIPDEKWKPYLFLN